MGGAEELDFEEIKYICGEMIKGRSDTQILGTLAEDWGKRNPRTIRSIRRAHEATREVIIEKLEEIKSMQGTPAEVSMDMVTEIYDKMSKGLRPVRDEKTGKIRYESWLEI